MTVARAWRREFRAYRASPVPLLQLLFSWCLASGAVLVVGNEKLKITARRTGQNDRDPRVAYEYITADSSGELWVRVDSQASVLRRQGFRETWLDARGIDVYGG